MTKQSALDLPYISLRTLLDSEHDFPLDYSEVGTKAVNMTIKKQVNWLLDETPEAKEARSGEIQAIRESLKHAHETPYSTGTEHVDHRLRQILVPKSNAPCDCAEGYVSLTPITASSIFPLFFEKEHGLVTQHNEKVKAAKDNGQTTHRKILQAQFGIGGANPQNIGSLVRNMQRPIFVSAPQQAFSVKEAFSIYHKGIKIRVHERGLFRDAVLAYVRFRKATVLSEYMTIGMAEREHEKKLIGAVAYAVLDMGAQAHAVLSAHSDSLPKEQCLSQNPVSHALVAPGVQTKAMRALIDPALRPLCDHWPRRLAQEIAAEMLRKNDQKNTDGAQLLLLDSSARSYIESIFEEVFFSCNM